MNIEVVFLVYSDYPIFRGEQQLPIFLLNMGLHLCQDHVVRCLLYTSDAADE